MAESRYPRVDVRCSRTEVGAWKDWARGAGLATGRGDGVATLIREVMARHGEDVAADLRAGGDRAFKGATPAPRAPALPRVDEVDVVSVVVERSGLPRSTVVRKVLAGSVALDGRRLGRGMVRADKLAAGRLELDGVELAA